VRDVRFSALKKAVETRWRGSLVVWEPYRSPDDSAIRGWVHILHVPEHERYAVQNFARDVAEQLFASPVPFFVRATPREHMAYMLRRLGLRDARPRRDPKNAPPARRRRRAPRLRTGSSVRARSRA